MLRTRHHLNSPPSASLAAGDKDVIETLLFAPALFLFVSIPLFIKYVHNRLVAAICSLRTLFDGRAPVPEPEDVEQPTSSLQ